MFWCFIVLLSSGVIGVSRRELLGCCCGVKLGILLKRKRRFLATHVVQAIEAAITDRDGSRPSLPVQLHAAVAAESGLALQLGRMHLSHAFF